MDFFSRALQYEYRNSGITVQTLIPGYVSTNMTKYCDLVHDPGESLAGLRQSCRLCSISFLHIT